jgi:hypothetical protein
MPDREELLFEDDNVGERVEPGEQGPSQEDVEAYLAQAMGLQSVPQAAGQVGQSPQAAEPVPPDIIDEALGRIYTEEEVQGQQPETPAAHPQSAFVRREGFERVKGELAAAKEEAGKWSGMIDRLKAAGFTDGDSVMQWLAQNANAQQQAQSGYGMEYGQTPTPSLPPQMPQGAPVARLAPEDRALMERFAKNAEQQEVAAEQQRLSTEIQVALQRNGLDQDPLAKDFVRMAIASGVKGTLDQIAKAYITKRTAAMQGVAALKAQAGSLTPDVRGGRPGTSAPKSIGRMTEEQRREIAAKLLAQSGALERL